MSAITSSPDITPSYDRLPNTVVPVHYQLIINTNFENFTFSGHVIIDIKITKSVDSIVLHGSELTIDNARFYKNNDNTTSQNGNVTYDKKNEQIKFKFDKLIQAGEGKLDILFTGIINDQLRGFYRTQHKTAHENSKYGACTQFQPADCRRAFPSWDEPSFKATFSITLRVPKHLLALSNMPVKSEQIDKNNDSMKIVEFDVTPIMSTYLVAYVIGEYDYVEQTDPNGVLVRVYTPIGKKEQGLFALETTSRILPFYADYFGIKYPLAKLDLIAVPDFGAGAMENWGLITFCETYLLIDNHTSTQKSRQEAALVIAHELAHQWFGNLVTMTWWDDLWLNEGFASWVEYLAVDHIYPEYDIWTQFVASTLADCMIPDALRNSHPIEMPISKASEIDEIFDEISYEKGSSIIRLLHSYIGNEAFQKGLSNYLKEYAYRNTITDNLWQHLSKTAQNKPVSEVLSTWTKQMGYPLLTVSQEQQGNNRVLTVEQSRFLADGSVDDENLLWKIPITICTKSNPNEIVHQVFLNGEKKKQFVLEKIPESDWIKLNLFSVGIYRVKYPSKMLDDLLVGIHDHTLSPQDRFNVQNDLYALSHAGISSYIDYLKLLRSYKQEDNYTVWKSIVGQLSDLSSILEYRPDLYDLYKKFIIDLLSQIYLKLEWDPRPNEGSQTPMLRSSILTQMALNGHQKTIDEAKIRFQQYLKISEDNNAINPINPNIRGVIYLVMAKDGNQQTYEQLKTLYLKADSQEEKVRLLVALCYFDDPNIIRQALDFVFDTKDVRAQDQTIGFSACSHNVVGRELCWSYLQKNWQTIVDRFGERDPHLIDFVDHLLPDFVTEEKANEIEAFFSEHETPLLDRTIKKALEQIQTRADVLKREEENIRKFLMEHVGV